MRRMIKAFLHGTLVAGAMVLGVSPAVEATVPLCPPLDVAFGKLHIENAAPPPDTLTFIIVQLRLQEDDEPYGGAQVTLRETDSDEVRGETHGPGTTNEDGTVLIGPFEINPVHLDYTIVAPNYGISKGSGWAFDQEEPEEEQFVPVSCVGGEGPGGPGVPTLSVTGMAALGAGLIGLGVVALRTGRR